MVLKSCPSRGTWIEMPSLSRCWTDSNGRAPRGARGLKYDLYGADVNAHIVVPLAGHVD